MSFNVHSEVECEYRRNNRHWCWFSVTLGYLVYALINGGGILMTAGWFY